MRRTTPTSDETLYIFLNEETRHFQPTINLNPQFLKRLTDNLDMEDEENIVINGNIREWCLFFTMIIEQYLVFRDNDNEVLDLVLSDLKNDETFNTEIMDTFLKFVTKGVEVTKNTEIHMTGSVVDFEKYFQLLKVIDYRISQSLLTNYPSGFKIKEKRETLKNL